jgi:hypothetical protein
LGFSQFFWARSRGWDSESKPTTFPNSSSFILPYLEDMGHAQGSNSPQFQATLDVRELVPGAGVTSTRAQGVRVRQHGATVAPVCRILFHLTVLIWLVQSFHNPTLQVSAELCRVGICSSDRSIHRSTVTALTSPKRTCFTGLVLVSPAVFFKSAGFANTSSMAATALRAPGRAVGGRVDGAK